MKAVALIPGGLEDQIFCFPALDGLKQAYPNMEIAVVAESSALPIYRLSKSVSSTIPFAFQSYNSPADWANLLGILRDRYYDVAFTVSDGWSAGLLLWLAGTPTRIGYGKDSKTFLTQTVPYRPEQYRPKVYHDLIAGFDTAIACPALSLKLGRTELDWAEAEQKRLNIGGGGYVVFYNNDEEGRTYPLERWQAIAQDFREKQPSLPLVALKDGGNADWATALADAIPDLVVTAPTTWGQQAAMIAGANLMVCTPGVPMQFAIALEVFTLGMIGSDKSDEIMPAGDKFLAIAAPNGELANLSADTVLQKIWGG